MNSLKDVFEGRFAKISGENPEAVSSFGRVRKRNRSLDDDFSQSDEEDLLGSSLFKQRSCAARFYKFLYHLTCFLPSSSSENQTGSRGRSRKSNPSYADDGDSDPSEDDEEFTPSRQRYAILCHQIWIHIQLSNMLKRPGVKRQLPGRVRGQAMHGQEHKEQPRGTAMVSRMTRKPLMKIS